MRGWTEVTEALMRGHRPANGTPLPDYHEIALLVKQAGHSVILALELGDSDVIMPSLSLAATMRKLVRLLIPLETHKAGVLRLQLWDDHPSKKEEWGVEHAKRFEFVVDILWPLMGSIEAMNRLLPHKLKRSHRTSTAADVQEEINLDDGKPFDDMENSLDVMFPHLLASNLIACIQVCSWIENYHADVAEPTAIDSDHHATQSDEQFALANMKELVSALVEVISKRDEGPISEAKPIWEQSAVSSFLSGLLIGCCHLRCTNLSGLSEADLKTQLCSGCRKARYCCVECQRSAWLDGGHSTVCGNTTD